MQLMPQPFLSPPLILKGEPGSPPSGGESDTDHDLESSVGHGGRVLVCKVCHAIITRPDLAMRVDGDHRHVFFNPYGYVFEIGCFASAKNIVPTGPKTDEFTWFPNHAWQAIACSDCSTLLGWRYTGRDSGFYGFILTALMEEEGRKA